MAENQQTAGAPVACKPHNTLYLFDGYEFTIISRSKDGRLSFSGGDDMPENFHDGVGVAGLYRFVGEIHHAEGWTPEQCEAVGIPSDAANYSEWWHGSMEDATLADVAHVFGLEALAAASEPVAWDDRAQQHRVLSELQEILHEAAGHGISPSFHLLGAVRDMISHPNAAAEPVSQPYNLAGEPVASHWSVIRFAFNEVIRVAAKGLGHEEESAMLDELARKLDDNIREYAHPRPRVGVTEALRDVIEWALGERDAFPDRPERVQGKPYAFYWWRTEMRRRYEAALALADEAAPGVVERDLWWIVDERGNKRFETWHIDDANEALREADASWPHQGPHRIMRVCLKPLATGGGEVNGDD